MLNDNMDIDKAMKKIENIDNRIKFSAFGKTRVNKNKREKGAYSRC